jgi:hypothetical protein
MRGSRPRRPEKRRRRQSSAGRRRKGASNIRKAPALARRLLPPRPNPRNRRRAPVPGMSIHRQKQIAPPPNRPPSPRKSAAPRLPRPRRLPPQSARFKRPARPRPRLNRLPALSRPRASRKSGRRNTTLRHQRKRPGSRRDPARRPSSGSTRRRRIEPNRPSCQPPSALPRERGFSGVYACCCIRNARRLAMVGAFAAFSGFCTMLACPTESGSAHAHWSAPVV